jgi:two-component system phosphate regulon response regulator PhoB
MDKQKILVIEDDPDIRELIAYNLELSGYETIREENGKKGLISAKQDDPDLIILDLMLPDMDGFNVCRYLKKDTQYRKIPVIMLTARSEEDDMIEGLEAGADDYITKPFSPRVLLARVKAALRRTGPDRETPVNQPVNIHGIRIDPARHQVYVDDEQVELSATEFDILRFLAENPGWVFSRNQIIDAVKGEDYPVTARSVDVQILGIRRKIGTKGRLIETVRGVGYRMKE